VAEVMSVHTVLKVVHSMGSSLWHFWALEVASMSRTDGSPFNLE
jgi:hypothetical protein